MKHPICIFSSFLFGILAGSFLFASPASGGVRSGFLNNQPIRLQTEVLQNGEYIRASDLVPFFANRWKYDGLSETLIITRQDGVRIGMSVGSQRIVVGNQAIPIRKPIIRRQGQIYIPFLIVADFVFPGADFREGEKEGDTLSPQQTPTADMLAATPFRLSQLPLTPFPLTPSSFTTPTPTVVQFPQFEDLVNTPTPITTVESVPPQRAVPRAMIILDPGGEDNLQGKNLPGGVRESTITFGVTRKLAAFLMESPNFEVLITQQENKEPLTPEQRTGFANQYNDGINAGIFVSIQCGSMFTNTLSKAVVYYMNPMLDESKSRIADATPSRSQFPIWDDAYREYVPESLRLARTTNLRLKEFYSFSNIITIENDPRPGRLVVLRALTMPGILIELGNLSHRDTALYLSRVKVQEDLAFSLYRAINDFLYERTGIQYSSPSQPN